ncbi:hypothetical protein [Lignipirellula cremea]|uniref:Uncharacterized protein n=1 Tax=Lignipirellula cremea TaxID=2528010 RepID=A0A518DQ09_9BACT|nr:hypothetical protein [Lignipirellula cremea]QDU93929.1 hypothetical protein Pla8534_17150 [Lignipirellula cremea]
MLWEEMEPLFDEHPDLHKDKIFLAFLRHVQKLRMSRKGRFVRVHFKTGRVVDLVPEGSLASGVEMEHDERRRCGWKFVSPKLQRAWQDFKTEYKKQN